MIGYGNDMYVPSYEGDAWSWGGQPWGSGYEQVQYDCSGTWGDYQQQPSWQAQAQEAPGPKVGAELLTELRLAELKRLIDRDARDLRASTEVVDIESTDSADCTTRTPDSNEDTPQDSPTKEAIGSSAHSAGQDMKSRRLPCDDGETGDLAPARTSSSRTQVVTRCEDYQADSGAATSSSTAPAPPPPGLDAPEEECCVAIADFSPESRNYGELPVSVGEEIFISGEPVDGWIFGVKRAHDEIVDEGWLPASALPISSPSGFEEDTAPRVRHNGSQSSGGNSRRGGRNQQQAAVVGSGGSRKGLVTSQQQQQRGAAQNSRKGGRADTEQSAKGGGKGDEQPWHQHGNWWSRQRHLRQDSKDADSHVSNSIANVGGSRKGSSRPAPPPPPPATLSEEEQDAHSGRKARGARGSRGGRGNGSTAGSRANENRAERQCEPERPVERPARERRALTTMLDRLNKPLVNPKSVPADQSCE